MPSIKGNILWNAIRVISNMFFPLITFPYASRVLGPDPIGLYNYVYSIASYFTLFASFGFTLYGTREIAVAKIEKTKLETTANSIITANLLIVLAVSLVYLCFCIFWVETNRLLYFVVGTIIIFTPMSFEWFYQGLEDFKYLTIRGIVIKTISLVCLFIFVKNSNDLLIYAILSVAAICGNNILNLLRLKRYIKIRISLRSISKHLRGASILFLGTIATSLYTYLNNIIVGLFGDMSGVAFFSTGNRLVHFLISIIGIITVSIMPRMSAIIDSGDRQQAYELQLKTVNLILYIALPLSVGVFILAAPIVNLYAGEKFAPATDVVKILSSLIILIPLSSFFVNQILIPHRKEKYSNIAIFGGAILNVLLALLLVRRFSYLGVATSLILAELGITLLSGLFSSKYTLLTLKDYFPLHSIIATVALGLICSWIYSLNPGLLQAFISAVCGSIIYVAFLHISKDKFYRENILRLVLNSVKSRS